MLEPQQYHELALMRASLANIETDVSEVKQLARETNGRLRRAEINVAILRFAVYTIGGSLVLAGLQVLIGKFSGAGL
jgi:hypothetical protein